MTRDELLAEKMNLLPEVEWDRWGGWYDYPGDEGIAAAAPFGWIAREDGRFDFIVLHVFWTREAGLYHTAHNTSSARFSEEFSVRLGNAETHLDCRRIEDDLGDLVDRKVELDASTGSA